MKKTLFTIILIFLLAPTARAEEVVSVMSYDIPILHEALAGFKVGCKCTVKNLIPNKGETPESIERKIRSYSPSVIYVMGEKALNLVKHIKDLTIIHTHVSLPWLVIPGENENITGVSMQIPAKILLDRFLREVPWVRKIGLVYDPKETGPILKKARAAASELDVEIIALATSEPSESAGLIESLVGKMDAYWMLPDITVISHFSIGKLMALSKKNKIPVLSFNDYFVEQGALMALSIEDSDMGLQAGEMIKKAQTGGGFMRIPVQYSRKSIFSINKMVARNLGIKLNKNLLLSRAVKNVIYKKENF